MPFVRIPDFANVSAGGIAHWGFVCGLLFGFRLHPGSGEMADIYLPDNRSDRDRSARPTASRLGELAGLCSGTVFVRTGTAERQHGVLSFRKPCSSGATCVS